MVQLTLIDPETGKEEKVKLIVRYRKVLEFEKNCNDHTIIKLIGSNGGAPDFTAMAKILYIGYLGGLNKTEYSFDEFVDRLDFNLNSLMETYSKLINAQKN